MKAILKENENKVYDIYRVERNAIVLVENGRLYRVSNNEVLQVINDRGYERGSQSTPSRALSPLSPCP